MEKRGKALSRSQMLGDLDFSTKENKKVYAALFTHKRTPINIINLKQDNLGEIC